MQQPPHGRPPTPPYRPPGGAPTGTPQPGGPPPGQERYPSGARPPAGVPAGAPQSPAAYAQTHGYPGAAAPNWAPPAPARKRRGSLRFLAGTCVFSAWLTLVISILLAGWSFVGSASASHLTSMLPTGPAAVPSSIPPGVSPGGEDGSGEGIPGMGGQGIAVPGMGGSGSTSPLLPMLGAFLPGIFIASGLFTLVTGAVTFLIFLGLGQACYALLDLEEQSFQLAQMLQAVMLRVGVGR